MPAAREYGTTFALGNAPRGAALAVGRSPSRTPIGPEVRLAGGSDRSSGPRRRGQTRLPQMVG